MKRTLISPDLSKIPDKIIPYFSSATVYDSSCSPEARVMFIDKDKGYYLKTAEKGTLFKEAEMTRYFHKKGLAAEVVEYVCDECDYLLTERISGEDCTYKEYIDSPTRLVDTLAERLRMLHELSYDGCPITDRTRDYLSGAYKNYQKKMFDASYISNELTVRTPDEAWSYIQANKGLLKSDTLLHGDYCLPNIMLDKWSFSGFIDLGGAGVGDRHIDLFWGGWTLNFNLKTDRYRNRFFDAYGRDLVNKDTILLVSVLESFG